MMKNGELVPQSVTIALLKNAMISSGAKDFLIDGFPRALDQAEEFEASIKKCEFVIFLECTEEEMEKRLLHRGQTSGRSDDNAATIKKRFHTFVNQSLPVIDHYEALGKCHKISSLAPPDEVFAKIETVLDEATGVVKAAPAAEPLTVPMVEGSLPEDARIVFILGGPGSGKGTQCERIVKKYGFNHLSAGTSCLLNALCTAVHVMLQMIAVRLWLAY
jgi:adenylate kinase